MFQKSNCAENRKRYEDATQAAVDAHIEHEDASRALKQVERRKEVYYRPVSNFLSDPEKSDYRRLVVYNAFATLTPDTYDFINVHNMFFVRRNPEGHRQLLRDLENARNHEKETNKQFKNLLREVKATKPQTGLQLPAQPPFASIRSASTLKKECAFFVGY